MTAKLDFWSTQNINFIVDNQSINILVKFPFKWYSFSEEDFNEIVDIESYV